MKKNTHYLLILWMFQYIQYGFCSESSINEEGSTDHVKDSRGLFSPRMDYDQWTPLGRGDPLKNDPTYDYVPPVLDRVHYWIDPVSRQPDPPVETKKTEILVLGVSSKKPSTASAPPQLESRRDTYDPFLKFVEAPKFNFYRHKPYSASFYSPPYYHTKVRFDPTVEEQRVPYTMLMPPPIQTAPVENYTVRFESTTDSSVSIAAANLIFQSSTTDWDNFRATVADASSQVTWRTPTPSPELQNKTVKPKPYKTTSQRPNFVLHPNHLKFPPSNYRKPIGFSFETSMKPTSFKPFETTVQTMQTMLTSPQTTTPGNKISFPDHPTPLLQNYLQSESKISQTIITTPPTTTTTTQALTTDPLFSHYKQPISPIRGPMYLIIQGHSKVKTYGAKPSHGLPENNEIPYFDIVKHLHTNHIKDDNKEEKVKFKEDSKEDKMKFKEEDDNRRLRISKDLQSLQHILKTGQGAIDFTTLPDTESARQKRNFDVKEALIGAQYKVGGGDLTTEKYRKGIVEAGDISDFKRANFTRLS